MVLDESGQSGSGLLRPALDERKVTDVQLARIVKRLRRDAGDNQLVRLHGSVGVVGVLGEGVAVLHRRIEDHLIPSLHNGPKLRHRKALDGALLNRAWSKDPNWGVIWPFHRAMRNRPPWDSHHNSPHTDRNGGRPAGVLPHNIHPDARDLSIADHRVSLELHEAHQRPIASQCSLGLSEREKREKNDGEQSHDLQNRERDLPPRQSTGGVIHGKKSSKFN